MDGGVAKDDIIALVLPGGMPSRWTVYQKDYIENIIESRELGIELVSGLGEIADVRATSSDDNPTRIDTAKRKAKAALTNIVLEALYYLDINQLKWILEACGDVIEDKTDDPDSVYVAFSMIMKERGEA